MSLVLVSAASLAASITKVIAVVRPCGGITTYERQGQNASKVQDSVLNRPQTRKIWDVVWWLPHRLTNREDYFPTK